MIGRGETIEEVFNIKNYEGKAFILVPLKNIGALLFHIAVNSVINL